jgi:5-oxoprolinase (ATP-hydrolysing)
VDYGNADTMRQAFETAHRQQFGFTMPGKGLVAAAAVIEVIGASGALQEEPDLPERSSGALQPLDRVTTFMGGDEHAETPVYEREQMLPGDTVNGPAIIREPVSTIIVEPGWQARVNSKNHIVMERVKALPRRTAVGTDVDPVMLEVFNNLFMSVAEQMGGTLEKTAYSANIKERLDFSCAVFDAEGGLVANAPHVPVHLGSMGESVRAIIAERRETMQPGDVYVLNDPTTVAPTCPTSPW